MRIPPRHARSTPWGAEESPGDTRWVRQVGTLASRGSGVFVIAQANDGRDDAMVSVSESAVRGNVGLFTAATFVIRERQLNLAVPSEEMALVARGLPGDQVGGQGRQGGEGTPPS